SMNMATHRRPTGPISFSSPQNIYTDFTRAAPAGRSRKAGTKPSPALVSGPFRDQAPWGRHAAPMQDLFDACTHTTFDVDHHGSRPGRSRRTVARAKCFAVPAGRYRLAGLWRQPELLALQGAGPDQRRQLQPAGSGLAVQDRQSG